MNPLVEGVKAYALEHYNEGGWDYVVECYTDEELAVEIGDAKTLDEAIQIMGEIVSIHHEQREAVRREIF